MAVVNQMCGGCLRPMRWEDMTVTRFGVDSYVAWHVCGARYSLSQVGWIVMQRFVNLLAERTTRP